MKITSMNALDKYASQVAQGLKTGVSDITRNAFADIGNRYQEILMADATIKPGDILPRSEEIGQQIAEDAAKQEIEQDLKSQEPQQDVHEPHPDNDR
jgi:hypothetical protein